MGTKTSIFPIPIKYIGITVTMISVCLFAGLAWYALDKVHVLDAEMQSRNSSLAEKELLIAVEDSINQAADIVRKLVSWDETIQQLNNPVYYTYWRANRLKEASFIPDYFLGVDLYSQNGVPLSKQYNSLFAGMDRNKLGAYLKRNKDTLELHYISEVRLENGNDLLLGYVSAQFNFDKLLDKMQKFVHLNKASLVFEVHEGQFVKQETLYTLTDYSTTPNHEYNVLQTIMTNTLVQFAAIGVISILGFLYILFGLIAKPVAILSHHVDALSIGRHNIMEAKTPGLRCVSEFAKLRDSLNDYVQQLNRLERMASGDMNDIIKSDTESSELMISFNLVATRLKEMMIEKDRVTQQLRKQAHELRKVSSEAMAANKAKSGFLANMSHEIRTPLTAIIGFAEATLDKDQSESERVDAMHTIISSGQHLLQIINDILDISKVEADKLEIEKASISPFEVLYEVETLVRAQAEGKGIEFALHPILPLPIRILSDSIRIKQVILNLCNNAIKFTHSGHVYINMSSDPYDKKLIIDVVDTGIGLSERQISKLFTPFTQADASTTRQYGGTGLGLSLSKRLTELLGGNLTVRSQLNVGSTFTATFDMGDLSGEDYIHNENEIPRYARSISDYVKPQLLKGKVLVADDVPENQKLVAMYLNKLGLQSVLVDNGFNAVERYSQGDIDIILMDMQMPIMDGVEATIKLRQQGANVPIIALTANAFQEDKERCLEAGCDSFLVKPINREKLGEVLAKYLQGSNKKAEQNEMIKSELLLDSNDFAALVDSYINLFPDSLKDLESTLRDPDWLECKATLHRIKGTAANMGFPMVAELASQLEEEAERSNKEAIYVGIDKFRKYHAAMRRACAIDEESPSATRRIGRG